MVFLAAKVALGKIKTATNDNNSITEQRINQIISQGGKEVEQVIPRILRGAIEDVYQTPFRLLGNFGKQQLNKTKILQRYYIKDTTLILIVCTVNQTIIKQNYKYCCFLNIPFLKYRNHKPKN